ncbi:MAG: beta-mannosidase [Chitinophagaceae bacterium]|nr:MAG: beta-mannosidase [Chitinophagaceae bacterium]
MKIIFCVIVTALWLQVPAQGVPADKSATKQTVNLYKNLEKLVKKGYMVGHQDALAYGVEWKYESGRSDIKDVTGDYPAVYGWELGHIENGAAVNLDSVPFRKMRQYISDAYSRGGVITISWHGDNPMTGKSAWDPAPGTVESIQEGGDKHAVFIRQLDKVADFLLSLKGPSGELIPVIFRPFHEHTGGWFWWGNKTTNDDQYKGLFRFTVDYLKHKRKVHNLLYAYNTGTEFTSAETYLERYPGDDVVDLLTFDCYQGATGESDSSYRNKTARALTIVEAVAKQKGKIAAVGETGYNQVPAEKWWTETLAPALAGHQFAYVLFWRNAGLKKKENQVEYYVPFKGQRSAADFRVFYRLPETLFQKDLNFSMIYK